MKKKSLFFALVVIAIVSAAYPLMAENSIDDPGFSQVDGVYFSDPTVDCDELKNFESCEIFKADKSSTLVAVQGSANKHSEL